MLLVLRQYEQRGIRARDRLIIKRVNTGFYGKASAGIFHERGGHAQGRVKRRSTPIPDVQARGGGVLPPRICHIGGGLIKQRGDDAAVENVRPTLVFITWNIQGGDLAVCQYLEIQTEARIVLHATGETAAVSLLLRGRNGGADGRG